MPAGRRVATRRCPPLRFRSRPFLCRSPAFRSPRVVAPRGSVIEPAPSSQFDSAVKPPPRNLGSRYEGNPCETIGFAFNSTTLSTPHQERRAELATSTRKEGHGHERSIAEWFRRASVVTTAALNSARISANADVVQQRGRRRPKDKSLKINKPCNAGVARSALQNRGLQVRFLPGLFGPRRAWSRPFACPAVSMLCPRCARAIASDSCRACVWNIRQRPSADRSQPQTAGSTCPASRTSRRIRSIGASCIRRGFAAASLAAA
jgi:hypothetical protein